MIKVEMKDGEVKVFDGVTFNVEEGFMMMWDNENVIGAVKSEEIRSINIEEEKEDNNSKKTIEDWNEYLFERIELSERSARHLSKDMPKSFNNDYMRGYVDKGNEVKTLLAKGQKIEVEV